MKRRLVLLLAVTASVVLFPFRSPAPLVYTPGEGWTYEPVGGEGRWKRDRAKDQLDVAQEAFEAQDHGTALKAARRVVKVWPLSDYAPAAQYLVGRAYEARGRDERAFNEYQKVLTQYPRSEKVNDVLQRQYEIANRYLAGQWFKLWGVVPAFPSMDKTASMFEKIVKSGPYSEVGPSSQLRVGAAREKQAHYPEAVAAYERAADRYQDQPRIAADALYCAGIAYQKQAATAEYDQSMAGKAIATLADFITLYPNDPRAAQAQQIIASLKQEQARGNFAIAGFYAKRNKLDGALVYYNEVLQYPESPYATEARERIDSIKKQMETASK